MGGVLPMKAEGPLISDHCSRIFERLNFGCTQTYLSQHGPRIGA